jgi:hypothetical protein
MTALLLGTSSYRRRGARTPEIALVNMLVEQDPTNRVDGLVRFQRPGLAQFATVGAGPIRGIYRKLGVLGSFYYVVSGTRLYSVTTAGIATLIGAIPGTDLVSIDGSADRLIVVASGHAYSWDGSVLSTIAVPDINSVPSSISSVVFIAGYFILTVADSQHFFWLAPGDVDPDALNFASAENAPDNIVGAARIFDELWFFGQQTTEVFQLTGDLNAPFTPIIGRLYEKGCCNRSTIAVVDNTLFWVSNEFVAYRADTSPVRISDHSAEERLRNAGADDMRAWAFSFDGHTLYVVRGADYISLVHDVENKNWSRFKTYEQETWRAHLGVQTSGDLVIAGDDDGGILWELDPTISNDNGVVIEREITGGVPLLGAPQKCRNLSLNLAVGWAPISGEATNPKIQMRFSDDAGTTWSAWFEEHLGLQGKYRTRVIFSQLGIIYEPGRLFQFRVTDDAIFRVSFARINEAVAA